MITIKFKDINQGVHFMYNGNLWLKCSSRTARITEFNRVFYFKANDNVKLIGE